MNKRSYMSTWNYRSARPPPPAQEYRDQSTMNVGNVDNLKVLTLAAVKNLIVENNTTCTGRTVLESSLSVVGATTLSTLSVTSWTDLSGAVKCQSTLSVVGATQVGQLYVAGGTTCLGGVQVLSSVRIEGPTTIEGRLDVSNEVTTLSQFRNRVGVVDPQIGDLKQTVRNVDSNGWLVCDGRAVDRSIYAALFSVLGTSFGSGNGTTTFNLPNASGRILGTVGNGHAIGAKVGAETVAIVAGNLPEHTHSGMTNAGGTHAHGITDPGHTHTQHTINDDFNNSGENPPGFTGDSAGTRVWDNINAATTGITVNSAGEHTHYFTTDGGTGLNGTPMSVMQPTLFIGYTLIYAGV